MQQHLCGASRCSLTGRFRQERPRRLAQSPRDDGRELSCGIFQVENGFETREGRPDQRAPGRDALERAVLEHQVDLRAARMGNERRFRGEELNRMITPPILDEDPLEPVLAVPVTQHGQT